MHTSKIQQLSSALSTSSDHSSSGLFASASPKEGRAHYTLQIPSLYTPDTKTASRRRSSFIASSRNASRSLPPPTNSVSQEEPAMKPSSTTEVFSRLWRTLSTNQEPTENGPSLHTQGSSAESRTSLGKMSASNSQDEKSSNSISALNSSNKEQSTITSNPFSQKFVKTLLRNARIQSEDESQMDQSNSLLSPNTSPRNSSINLLPERKTSFRFNKSMDSTTTIDEPIVCSRCKSEVTRVNGEWVAQVPRSDSKSSGRKFASVISSVLNLNEDRPYSYCGSINFSLHYDFSKLTLTIVVIQAKDLLAKDRGGTSDPYVKILLLPEKKKKLETKVIFKKLNPVWNETLEFRGYPYEKLQKRVLHILVLDYDKFSRDDPIGEVNIPMCELDLQQPYNVWKDLNPISKEKFKRGEILITLQYNAVTGRLTVYVIKARNLKPMDISGTSDPYVKLYHMHLSRRIEKVKTRTKYQSLNPVYNEEFTFNVPYNKLDDTQVVVTVMDKDLLKWNEKIGSIVLSKRSGHKEMEHWNQMLNKQRQGVNMWHFLRADD